MKQQCKQEDEPGEWERKKEACAENWPARWNTEESCKAEGNIKESEH